MDPLDEKSRLQQSTSQKKIHDCRKVSESLGKIRVSRLLRLTYLDSIRPENLFFLYSDPAFKYLNCLKTVKHASNFDGSRQRLVTDCTIPLTKPSYSTMVLCRKVKCGLQKIIARHIRRRRCSGRTNRSPVGRKCNDWCVVFRPSTETFYGTATWQSQQRQSL